MKALWLALLLLALPADAWADGAKFVQLIGSVLTIVGAGTPLSWIGYALVVAGSVYGSTEARRKQRMASAKARAAYNDALMDRSITTLSATPAQRVVYGRAITGGDVVAIFATDKATTREDGTAYTKPDALKHVVIAFAAHECQAINEIYIDGVAVGALDGSGYPTGGAFAVAGVAAKDVSFTTTTTVADTVLAVLGAYSGTAMNYASATVTLTPPSTLDGPAGVPVVCNYSVATSTPVVRIHKHLGAASQTVDTYLNGLLPSEWTSDDRLRGIAYIVITLDLEDARFQGGLPNITADISGKLLYDPRDASTAYSDNPALCVRDFLASEYGYGVSSDDIDDASVITAANACDELIDLTVGGVTASNVPTFTCNGVFTTQSGRESVLEDLCECMAGHAVYGAHWRVLAGTWTAPVLALTDADLDGQIEVTQAGAGMDELVNGMRGTYIGAGKATPTDFDSYQNAIFLAADDSVELWADLVLPFTDNRARARNLCRIFVERGRSSQVIRYPAKLVAWPLEVGDRVTVTSAEYGFEAKTYRVTDWQFGLSTAVQLTLQEDVAETYDLADAASADPSPNTGLPDPWEVAAITSLDADSGTAQLEVGGDGTVTARVQVSWDAITDAYVVDGSGRIELLWRQAGSLDKRQQVLPGNATGAWIDRVAEGQVLVIEARAVNGLGLRGPSAFIGHVVVGKTAAPGNVAGFAAVDVNGDVAIGWTASAEADYGHTEVRHGASYAAGTFVGRIKGSVLVWPYPSTPGAGAITLYAKHVDTSGNESGTAASAGVTITAPTLGGLDSTASTKLSGIATGATKNTVTYASSAPGSPTDGDLWCDTSATPAVWKIRVSGAWQAAANYTTGALAMLNTVGTAQIDAGAVGTGNIATSAATAKATHSLSAGSLTVSGGIVSSQDKELTSASLVKIAGSSLRMTVSGYIELTFKGSGFSSGTKKLLAQVSVICRDGANALAFTPQADYLWFREEPIHVELSSVYRIPFERNVEYVSLSATGTFHVSITVYAAVSDQLGTFSAIDAISSATVTCFGSMEEVKR